MARRFSISPHCRRIYPTRVGAEPVCVWGKQPPPPETTILITRCTGMWIKCRWGCEILHACYLTSLLQIRVEKPTLPLFHSCLRSALPRSSRDRASPVIIESAETKKNIIHALDTSAVKWPHLYLKNKTKHDSRCMCICKTGSMSDTILTSQQCLEANKGKKYKLRESHISSRTCLRCFPSSLWAARKFYLIALHWLFSIKTITLTVDRS